MHCRTCDYPLWNIKARACPECGSSFKPSEFEFKPGAVRFCCPDCSQEYYGTSHTGHLRPSSFQCVKCQRQLEMDEMVLLPAEGWEDHAVTLQVTPWVRQDIGLLRRWLSTVGWSYVKPAELIRGIPADSGSAGGWAFYLITQCLIGLVGVALPLLVIVIIASNATAGGFNRSAAMAGSLIGPVAVTLVGTILIAVFWTLSIHAILRLSGGCAHSIGRTFACVFYSSGTLAAQAFPCLGPYCLGYIVGVWWLVSAILMVMEGQKVSGLRATFSVLCGPLVLMLVLVGLYALVITSAISTANTVTQRMSAMATGVNSTRVASVGSDFMRFSTGSDIFSGRGVMPDSPLDVIAAPGATYERYDFAILVTGNPSGTGTDVLGMMPQDFARLEGVPFDSVIEVLRQLERPPVKAEGTRDVVSLGGLVYCVPGFDMANLDTTTAERLWLIAAVRGPTVDDDFHHIEATSVDGFMSTTLSFMTLDQISSEIDAQDVVRAGLGLGSLMPALEAALSDIQGDDVSDRSEPAVEEEGSD